MAGREILIYPRLAVSPEIARRALSRALVPLISAYIYTRCSYDRPLGCIRRDIGPRYAQVQPHAEFRKASCGRDLENALIRGGRGEQRARDSGLILYGKHGFRCLGGFSSLRAAFAGEARCRRPFFFLVRWAAVSECFRL